ncbi:MAG TPA: hypothetical protein VNN62_10775 [Methylomirabilota bacterium]|jgi:hypothetical protein|nr:hypothetical protein [Methylomirabilota bacterium]
MKIPASEIAESLHKSGKLPYGWKPARQGLRKVKVKNLQILDALREHLPGEWRKVYHRGQDGTEIHYFEHEHTGKVWGVKVK